MIGEGGSNMYANTYIIKREGNMDTTSHLGIRSKFINRLILNSIYYCSYLRSRPRDNLLFKIGAQYYFSSV